MKLVKLLNNVYQVDFKTRAELLKTFLRFQEYYESPEFKGKIFTVKAYAKWYKSFYKKEKFTYYSDWSGCNVPSYVFHFFRQENRWALSRREKELLDLLPQEGDFYVIGTFAGGKDEVLEHEKAHGLFYSSPEYKEKVLKILDSYHEDLSEVFGFVKNLGYHDSVCKDEVHAYVSTTTNQLTEEQVNFPLKCHQELFSLYQEFLAK